VLGEGCAIWRAQGHLRRSEQIANEVLRKHLNTAADSQKRKHRSNRIEHVLLYAHQLAQAHQLLVRATEVDPNPPAERDDHDRDIARQDSIRAER